MPADGHGAARERWMGAQEAASFLGVHRSTLHAAVRQRLIVPDSQTPGGHLRFSLATLEAFRARLAQGPAAGGVDNYATERTLTRLAHLLVTGVESEQICQAAVAEVRTGLPGVDMCAVMTRAGDPSDRLRLRVVAQDNYPATAFADYARLHSTFRFATIDVLRDGVAAVCEDTARQPLHTGTARLCRRSRVGAYAIMPLRGREEALGVLACAGYAPRTFDERELAFLQGVGDMLATALSAAKRHARLAANLATGSALIRAALSPCHDTGSAEAAADGNAARLGAAFLHLTGALEVCALGFGSDLPPRHPRLRELACRACAADEPVHEAWSEGGTLHTGIAASVPVRGPLRGGVAALWHGERPLPGADHALLVTFAGAYLLALGLN
jgi:hypothetical protein